MHSPHQRFTIVVVTLLTIAGSRLFAQDTPRQLFEAGKYQAAIEKTGDDNAPAALYLKGLSHLKLNQGDAAKDAFSKVGGDASLVEPTGPGIPPVRTRRVVARALTFVSTLLVLSVWRNSVELSD